MTIRRHCQKRSLESIARPEIKCCPQQPLSLVRSVHATQQSLEMEGTDLGTTCDVGRQDTPMRLCRHISRQGDPGSDGSVARKASALHDLC